MFVDFQTGFYENGELHSDSCTRGRARERGLVHVHDVNDEYFNNIRYTPFSSVLQIDEDVDSVPSDWNLFIEQDLLSR